MKKEIAAIDTAMVRQRYERMTDKELEWFALHDAAALTVEAQELLKKEILKRNMDAALITGVEVQNVVLDLDQVAHFCEVLRQMPCPRCGSDSWTLNAVTVSSVLGLLIAADNNEKFMIACGPCLRGALRRATIKTVFLGWWGGPIESIQALRKNLKASNIVHAGEPSELLWSFTTANIGYLEAYKDNPDALYNLILNV